MIKQIFSLLAITTLGTFAGHAQKLAPTAQLAASQYAAQRQHSTFNGTAKAPGQAPETVKGFIRISHPDAIPQLEALGVKVRSNIKDQILTATMPVSVLEAAADIPTVERIELGAPVTPQMDYARAEANVNLVHDAAETLNRSYKGKGVVVGVVDAGFEYSHIAFNGEGSNTTRILRTWNQLFDGKAPEGYDYGSEYTDAATLFNRVTDGVSTMLHGTHVAGIAAGSDYNVPYYGVAPSSDLIFVTYRGNADDVVDGVKYIFDQADRLGRPCVVNLSLGVHIGPHDGSSLSDQAFEALAGPGRIIVGAVGNEARYNMHVSKHLAAGEEMKVMPSFLSLDNKDIQCDFWGDANKTFSIQPVVVNTLKGTIAYAGEKFSTATPTEQKAIFSLEENGIEGEVTVVTSTSPVNNRGNVFVNGSVTSFKTGCVIGFVMTSDDGDITIHGWNCHTTPFTANAKCQSNGWIEGDYNTIAAEIGGTSRGVISVGSYNARPRYTDASGMTYVYDMAYPVGEISDYSSKGPTVDGRMKPEVCAPGCAISAAQRYAINTERAAAVSTDSRGNKCYYAFDRGTSMAAPFVAGSVALWLEANPELGPDDIRNILRTSSRQDEFTDTPSANSKSGYGKIDVYNGLLAALDYDFSATGITAPAADGHNLRVAYDRTSEVLTNFQPGAVAEVYNAAGQRVLTSSDTHISLTHLAAGTYVVRLTDGRHTATQKILR